MMKKIIIGVLLAGVLLIGGGIYLVFSNLDGIIEQAIETAGSDAVGTRVSVDSVKVELTAGRATIYGFAVANPAGFSNADMISFDELSVALDMANITSENIGILSIVARNPRVVYETVNNRSNLDVVNEKLGGSNTSAQPADSGSSSINLSVGRVQIDGIGATVISDMLPQTMEVNLGNIDLQNLKGTPEQIASQITRPLINQLANNAARALMSASAEVLKEKADATREQMEDTLKESVDEKIGEDVRKGLGNLLNRD